MPFWIFQITWNLHPFHKIFIILNVYCAISFNFTIHGCPLSMVTMPYWSDTSDNVRYCSWVVYVCVISFVMTFNLANVFAYRVCIMHKQFSRNKIRMIELQMSGKTRNILLIVVRGLYYSVLSTELQVFMRRVFQSRLKTQNQNLASLG